MDMMARYRLTPKADRDLMQIWHYTNEKWGKAQANEYLQLLENCFLMLLRHPKSGRAADNLRYPALLLRKLQIGTISRGLPAIFRGAMF